MKDKNKRRSQKTAAVMAMTLLLLCILNSRIKVTAADMSGTLHSKGAMQCEQAVLDAADLRSIHSYLLEKKNAAASILLQLGTRFRQQSGEVVYDRNPDAEQEEVDLSQISWPVLIRAVEDSQTVPEGLSVLQPENAMHIEGVEEYTDFYRTAVSDKISR